MVVDTSDEALVRDAARGRTSAQQVLEKRLTMVIAGAARRFQRTSPRGADEASIDDLVQDGWVALTHDSYAALLGWRVDGGASLETYVVKVVVRGWVDQQRTHRRKKRGGHMMRSHEDPDQIVEEHASPEALAAARESATHIHEALETRLSPRGLLVLRLVFTDGCSVPEAAAAMQVTTQVIYNWVHKIRGIARSAILE